MFGFKMKVQRCGLCGGKLKKVAGIMQYLATNDIGEQEMFSMPICFGCADDLDAKHETNMNTEEVRDWMLRK